MTVIFAVKFTVCIMVLCYVLPMQLTLRKARRSFEKQDYEAAYEELYGRKLNASDQEIYNKSSIIMQVDRKYQSYENDKKMGNKLEGLDSLIQGVARYNLLKDQADSYGIIDKIKEIYDKILKALQDDYGVSEQKANEIADSKDDLTYTKSLYDVLGEEMPGSNVKTDSKDNESENKKDSGSDVAEETVNQTATENSTATGDGQGWADKPAGNETENPAETGTDGATASETDSGKNPQSQESVMYVIHTKK